MDQSQLPKSSPNQFISHLPLIGVILIAGFLVLIDTPVLESFRNETTFAWMLLVWIPLASLLALTQLYLWVRWFLNIASAEAKKRVQIGFLVMLSIFLGVFLFRNLQ